MGDSKQNCWEYMGCSLLPDELGRYACPVRNAHHLQGVNDGKAGGRICWVIAGTFCKGETQGTFVAKFDSCRQCEFYQQVSLEEERGFVLLPKDDGNLESD